MTDAEDLLARLDDIEGKRNWAIWKEEHPYVDVGRQRVEGKALRDNAYDAAKRAHRDANAITANAMQGDLAMRSAAEAHTRASSAFSDLGNALRKSGDDDEADKAFTAARAHASARQAAQKGVQSLRDLVKASNDARGASSLVTPPMRSLD